MTTRALPFDITPPGLLGGQSFRRRYKNEWAKVRKRRFAAGDFHCECCGEERLQASRLDGHEVYAFPDADTVRLDRVWYLCRLCHDAVHLERTRGVCGAKYVAEVEAHYCRVNGGLSTDDLESDFAEAISASRRLSDQYGGANVVPQINYGPLQDIADAFEARRRVRHGESDDDDEAGEFEMWPDHECAWDLAMNRD